MKSGRCMHRGTASSANGRRKPCLASWSARSFSAMPAWPGTHVNCILQVMDASWYFIRKYWESVLRFSRLRKDRAESESVIISAWEHPEEDIIARAKSIAASSAYMMGVKSGNRQEVLPKGDVTPHALRDSLTDPSVAKISGDEGEIEVMLSSYTSFQDRSP